jgi:hypothetical protein
VGLRADLDAVEKRIICCPCQESNRDSSDVQPVAAVAVPTELLISGLHVEMCSSLECT